MHEPPAEGKRGGLLHTLIVEQQEAALRAYEATRSGAGPPPSAPARQAMYDLILAFLRRRYDPVFRKESALYSASKGRLVKAAEACSSPTRALLAELAAACDAPRDNRGDPKLEQIAKAYRIWAGVAWQDLLEELPDEADSPQVVAAAAEDFRHQLAAALSAIVALGHTHRQGERTETQRRALLDFAALWARPGPWRGVRSYRLWHRIDEAGQLQIAVRAELFAQVGRPGLASLTQREFVRLAELYGLGQKGKAGGERVVVLDPAFVAELRSGPGAGDGWTDGRTDGDTPAGAREGCVQAPTSPQGDIAPVDPVDGDVDGAFPRPRERPRAGGCVGVNVDGDVDGDPQRGGGPSTAGGQPSPSEEEQCSCGGSGVSGPAGGGALTEGPANSC